uniref:Uncharacterized protein n=1 Tax=Meloidogyne javanica TaxID=6303 RepID=A0A915N232_MELJA
MFKQLIEDMKLIDEQVYSGTERLKEHYLNILLVNINNENFQKIRKVNELAANFLVWFKFMEGEINPLEGNGEWEKYERNFVVNYEDLISAENSVNNYYKGLLELLHDEMIVTEEDYKREGGLTYRPSLIIASYGSMTKALKTINP